MVYKTLVGIAIYKELGLNQGHYYSLVRTQNDKYQLINDTRVYVNKNPPTSKDIEDREDDVTNTRSVLVVYEC